MTIQKSVKEFKTTCRIEKKRKASEGIDETNCGKDLSSIQRLEDHDPSMLVGFSIQV